MENNITAFLGFLDFNRIDRNLPFKGRNVEIKDCYYYSDRTGMKIAVDLIVDGKEQTLTMKTQDMVMIEAWEGAAYDSPQYIDSDYIGQEEAIYRIIESYSDCFPENTQP